MKTRKKKVIAVALAAALTASLFGGQVSAVQYTGTDSYMSGLYYHKLQQVKRTGDPGTDIVAIAKSQVGYQEGNSGNQLTGEVYGSMNFTEYGAWYGAQDLWSAMFVSWCAEQAGVSTETIPRHSTATTGLDFFATRGLAYTRAEVQDRQYTPKPGDLIYFKSSRNAKPTNHMGIVTAYADGRVYTIEGDIGAVNRSTNGGMVVEKSYPITNNFIVFICAPDYESGGTSVLSDVREKEAPFESLRQALFAVETGDHFAYDSVSSDSMGRVTLGCGQWYGSRATELLNRIYEADPENYARLDPQRFLLQEGALTRLPPERHQILQQVLSSEAGVCVQNDWMDQCLQAWTDRAMALGVTDPDALLLCGALYQLRGAAVAEQVISKAGNGPAKDTLLNLINDLEPGLYRTCCLLVK